MEEENKEIKKNYTWILFALVSLITLITSIIFIDNNIGIISLVITLISSITGMIKYSKNSTTSLVIFELLIIFSVGFTLLILTFKIADYTCHGCINGMNSCNGCVDNIISEPGCG